MEILKNNEMFLKLWLYFTAMDTTIFMMVSAIIIDFKSKRKRGGKH